MSTLSDASGKRAVLDKLTLTTADVALMACCSERHIRRLDALRQIPGRLVLGRLIRYSRAEIERWLGGEAKS